MRERLGLTEGYAPSLIRLSYLSSAIVWEILDGTQPIYLTPTGSLRTAKPFRMAGYGAVPLPRLFRLRSGRVWPEARIAIASKSCQRPFGFSALDLFLW
jgi:hypothetical protein